MREAKSTQTYQKAEAKISWHEPIILAKVFFQLWDQREQLKAEVEKYKECDLEVIEEIGQANKVTKEAADIWRDNVFAIKSWTKREFEENKTVLKKFRNSKRL